MAKKDDITTYTKAELIKALRASLAREAKLQKRVATLEGQIAASVAHPATYEPGPYDVVHITQGPDTVSELVPRDLFPWEKD